MPDNIPVFKIGDLSKLFHVGVDSIRYYEKVGLLHPERDPVNHYRLYTLQDIRTMNTIRELLELGFTTEEILAFEQERNIAHAMDMLTQEEQVLSEKIQHLTEVRDNIRSRVSSIQDAENLDTSGTIHELDFPERKCMMITTEGMRDEEINYRLAQYTSGVLESGPHEHITTIGASDCYILDTENTNQDSGDYATKGVFFYSPYLKYKNNFALPAGHYLSAAFRGAFNQTRELYPKMLQYCQAHGLKSKGDLLEFCHVDRYETSDVSEYLTELQLQVTSD